MVQECSRDKILDLSLWFFGWLRHTLDDFDVSDFDVSSMIGHILYVYMIHTFWDIFFAAIWDPSPATRCCFSIFHMCDLGLFLMLWVYHGGFTMVLPGVIALLTLEAQALQILDTLNVWYICQHLPTKVNHSWFMLDVIFHAGRWRWRGLWWMRDWLLNSMQNIGISPREPPNQWKYWAPYAGLIPFPIGFWIGSRYGWLGVPVFFWAPWNFLLKTWCVGV